MDVGAHGCRVASPDAARHQCADHAGEHVSASCRRQTRVPGMIDQDLGFFDHDGLHIL